MFVLYVAFAITGVYHGTGQHAWEIQPPTEVPVGLKVSHSSIAKRTDDRSMRLLRIVPS